MIRLTYAPDFVEEAVLLAERTLSAADARAFRRERNLAYDVVDPDERERAFRDLHFPHKTKDHIVTTIMILIAGFLADSTP